MRREAFLGSEKSSLPASSPSSRAQPLELAVDPERAGGEVYVRPPQPERLIHTQPGAMGEDVQSLELVAARRVEKHTRSGHVERL